MIVTESMNEENHFGKELRPEVVALEEEDDVERLPQIKKMREMTNELGLLVQKLQSLDAQIRNLRTRIAFSRWAKRIGKETKELDSLHSAKLRTEIGLVLVALEKMLLKTDQIDSDGNAIIRARRKQLVAAIQQVVGTGEGLMKVARKLIKFQAAMLFFSAMTKVNEEAASTTTTSPSLNSEENDSSLLKEEEVEEKNDNDDDSFAGGDVSKQLRKSPKLAPTSLQHPPIAEVKKKRDPIYELNEGAGTIVITIQDANARSTRITLEGDQLLVVVPNRKELAFQLDLSQVLVHKAMREMLSSDVLRITIPKRVARQSFVNNPFHGRTMRWPKF